MNLARFPRRRYTEGQTPLEFVPNFTRALGGPNVYIKRDDLLAATRGIKSGDLDDKVISSVQAASDHLADRNAQALLIACTELSIIGHRILWNGKKYDSSQILAEAIVLEAKGKPPRA